jgi:hypothetical protein
VLPVIAAVKNGSPFYGHAAATNTWSSPLRLTLVTTLLSLSLSLVNYNTDLFIFIIFTFVHSTIRSIQWLETAQERQTQERIQIPIDIYIYYSI